jgi:hypothetical protein
VLNPATDELRMLNPFSAVPTAYRVRASGRWWYGLVPHTRKQNQAILARLGLSADFWRLA